MKTSKLINKLKYDTTHFTSKVGIINDSLMVSFEQKQKPFVMLNL